MKTLVNKENPEIKVIVPEIVEGEKYYILDKKYLPLSYIYDNSIYFSKYEWDLE